MTQPACLAETRVNSRSALDSQNIRPVRPAGSQRAALTFVAGVLLSVIGAILVRLDATCVGTLCAVLGAAIPLLHTLHCHSKRLLDSLQPIPMPAPTNAQGIAAAPGCRRSRSLAAESQSTLPPASRIVVSFARTGEIRRQPTDWMSIYALCSGQSSAGELPIWRN